MKRIWGLAAPAAIVLAMTCPAKAVDPDLIFRCQGPYKNEPSALHDRIEACTAIIQSGDFSDGPAWAFANRGKAHHDLGELAQAIDDYGEAIKLDPSKAQVFVNRGLVKFRTGELANAQADFDKATQLMPTNPYVALWRDLTSRRIGTASQLNAASAQLDGPGWPAPVVRLYLGELTADEVMTSAKDPDPKKEHGQTCEANFYIGELALSRGERDDATRHLQQAAGDCPKDFWEYFGALAELERLGQKGSPAEADAEGNGIEHFDTAAPAAPVAPAYEGPTSVATKGKNGNKLVIGLFTRHDDGSWQETNDDDADWSYDVAGQTPDYVDLIDTARNVSIRLDLNKKEVDYKGPKDKKWNFLYKITRVE